MKLYNQTATATIANMNGADAAYCAKMEQRFANMGISSKAASGAVVSLAESDAVPQVGSWAIALSALKDMLPKGLFQKKTEANPVASEAFEDFSVEALA